MLLRLLTYCIFDVTNVEKQWIEDPSEVVHDYKRADSSYMNGVYD